MFTMILAVEKAPLILGDELKKTAALLLCIAPLIVSLSGCGVATDLYKKVTGTEHSDKLAIDGRVDTPTGTYASIKVSDRHLQRITTAAAQQVNITSDSDPNLAVPWPAGSVKGLITKFFFNDFIDSPVIEGGPDEQKAWKTQANAEGTLSPSAFTQDLEKFVLEKSDIATGDFGDLMHDGKPRIEDANIDFTDATYIPNEDGTIYNVGFNWSVQYRVSEATARQIMKSDREAETGTFDGDEEFKKFLAEAPTLPSGEINMKISGTATWYVLQEAGDLEARNLKIYGVGWDGVTRNLMR